MELLTAPQSFELVDRWRHAARAAALGEHDLHRLPNDAAFNGYAAQDLLRDAAEIAQAVVVLDRRYANIPGWQSLFQRGYLARAASRAADLAQRSDPGYQVDTLGWKPPRALIPGRARQGFDGVVQAEHNLLIQLIRFPTALNLKRILDSQRELSHRLSQRVTDSDPALGNKWRMRTRTYHRLFAEARNLGGLIGDGSAAAAEGALALSRLRALPSKTVLTPDHMQRLDQLFEWIDHRIADAIEHGAGHRLYFTKATTPEIDPRHGQLVHGQRATFVPITSPVQTGLLNLAGTELRPPRWRPAPRPGAAEARAAFRAALGHRPGHQEISAPTL